MGGAVWSVGDGRTIRPFMDAWLPGRYDVRLVARPVLREQAGMVLAEWIDQDTKVWKEDAVRNALSAAESQCVLEVPILLVARQDELKWPFERKGRVTVRSAYHFIRDQSRIDDLYPASANAAEPATARSDCGLWDIVWKSAVMPKVRTFIWKLMSRAIVVREGLARRGMQVLNSCPICSERGSIEHLILDCEWVKRVWEQLLDLSDVWDGCISVNQWLRKRLADQTGTREGNEIRWQSILIACWSIWKCRCL